MSIVCYHYATRKEFCVMTWWPRTHAFVLPFTLQCTFRHLPLFVHPWMPLVPAVEILEVIAPESYCVSSTVYQQLLCCWLLPSFVFKVSDQGSKLWDCSESPILPVSGNSVRYTHFMVAAYISKQNIFYTWIPLKIYKIKPPEKNWEDLSWFTVRYLFWLENMLFGILEKY